MIYGIVCLVVVICCGFLLSMLIMANRLFLSTNLALRSYQMAAMSVHSVRPSQIAVVAALGDSFSVGYGADSDNMSVFQSNPEVSFCMGGGGNLKEQITIPNILQKLGASLVGYSTANSLGLNFAVPGAFSFDLPGQAQLLVDQFKQEKLNEKWKLLNIFIGLNDMGNQCFRKGNLTDFQKGYKKYLESALDMVSRNLERTIVNLVSVPNMASFPYALDDDENQSCSNIDMRQICDVLNEAIETIVKDGRFERDDFTIVQQPLLSSEDAPPKTESGAIDLSMFATDKFHLSRKGQSMYAVALWNNMMEPVGAKSSRYPSHPYRLLAPNEQCPYIRTSKNSVNCDGNAIVGPSEQFIEIQDIISGSGMSE